MHGLAWSGVGSVVGAVVGSVVMLLGAACYRTNPDYALSQGGGTSDDGAGDDPTTTGDGESGEAGGSGEGSGSSGEPVCMLHPRDPLEIELFREGVLRPPDCTIPGGETLELDPGQLVEFLDGDQLTQKFCTSGNGCGCDTAAEATYSIQFGGTLPDPQGVPPCGRVVLWGESRGPDDCMWVGVLVEEPATSIPRFIAARSLQVPVFSGSLTLGLEPEQTCEPHQCSDAPPGRYQLDVLGERVSVEDSPRDITVSLNFGMELPYRFDNRMSSVDQECLLQVAWTAVSPPP